MIWSVMVTLLKELELILLVFFNRQHMFVSFNVVLIVQLNWKWSATEIDCFVVYIVFSILLNEDVWFWFNCRSIRSIYFYCPTVFFPLLTWTIQFHSKELTMVTSSFSGTRSDQIIIQMIQNNQWHGVLLIVFG